MKNSFIANIIFLVFINLLIKPIYVFVIDVSVQNTVGNSSYGIFFALFNLCYLFQIICDLGIQNYSTREIAKDNQTPSEFIANILGFKLLLSIVFIAWIFFLILFLQYDPSLYKLVGFIAINQVLVSFILYLRTSVSALGHYALDSLLSVIDKIILIVLIGYLLWTNVDNAFDIYDFVYSQTFAFVVTLLIVLLIVSRLANLRKISFKPTFNKNLLQKTLPYALVILLMGAYARIDAVMLERLLDDGTQEAGIYAASYRLLDAVNIVPYLFAMLLLPMLAKLKSGNVMQDLFLISWKLIFCISTSLALYIWFFGDELMLYLYPLIDDVYASSILKNLMFGFIAISMTHIFSTLLTASGKLRQMNWVFALGLLLNVILNFIYIPTYKALAASLTTLGTECFVAIGLIVIVMKQFSFSFHKKDLSQAILFLVLILAIYYSIDSFTSLNWIYALILGGFSSIMVLLLLRILDIKELKTLGLFGNSLT